MLEELYAGAVADANARLDSVSISDLDKLVASARPIAQDRKSDFDTTSQVCQR